MEERREFCRHLCELVCPADAFTASRRRSTRDDGSWDILTYREWWITVETPPDGIVAARSSSGNHPRGDGVREQTTHEPLERAGKI
jgi:hypothetical protein